MAKFLDRARETSATTGTGTYSLDGAAAGFLTLVDSNGGSGTVFYFAVGDPAGVDATKWEFGYGTLTDGAPDTLTRNLIRSSTGALINWGAGNKIIIGAAIGAILNSMLITHRGTSRPAWLRAGALWEDSTSAPTNVVLKHYDGTDDISLLSIDETNNRAYLLDPAGAKVSGAQTDVASAATTNIGAATSDRVRVTGTTTITAFDTVADGVRRYVRFAGILTLTHNATSLILPSGANITTAANDEAVFISLGSGNWKCISYTRANGKALVETPQDALPRSYLAGFELSNNGTDPTNDIDIAVGECRDDADSANIELASALTKQLDVAWAVGTNQGMLDTGAVGDNTYHIFAIKRSDTGVVDVLASLSATSPTMPANYDKKRRIGSIIRSGGTILAFSQRGDEFLLNVPVRDVNTTNPGTSAVLATLTVPAGIKVRAMTTVNTVDTGANTRYVLVTSPDQADTAAAANMHNIRQTAESRTGSYTYPVRTNTSRQIRYRCDSSGTGLTVSIFTQGWIDSRGRDA